jgi:Asp/Glu/hydantoin racemase
MIGLPRILVINPNSTESVTEGIRNAVATIPGAATARIDCVTLANGPAGIETDEHVRQVIDPLTTLVRQEAPNSAAIVVACFSDPGLNELKKVTDLPVFGLGECAYRSAAASGLRFGVISILAEAIPRHRRYIRSLGLLDWLAEELAIGIGVTELADEKLVGGRLEETGRRLRDEHGAEVLILGCAGMAPYRDKLEAILELPIIEPCQTAVETALEAVFARQASKSP